MQYYNIIMYICIYTTYIDIRFLIESNYLLSVRLSFFFFLKLFEKKKVIPLVENIPTFIKKFHRLYLLLLGIKLKGLKDFIGYQSFTTSLIVRFLEGFYLNTIRQFTVSENLNRKSAPSILI